MTEVRLQGISGKGRNRVREHGEVWKVLEVDKDCLLVQSLRNSNYVRWVEKAGDFHFVIVG